jgi:hypothetical protein
VIHAALAGWKPTKQQNGSPRYGGIAPMLPRSEARNNPCLADEPAANILNMNLLEEQISATRGASKNKSLSI